MHSFVNRKILRESEKIMCMPTWALIFFKNNFRWLKKIDSIGIGRLADIVIHFLKLVNTPAEVSYFFTVSRHEMVY